MTCCGTKVLQHRNKMRWGQKVSRLFLLKHKACRYVVCIFWGIKFNQTERRKAISLAQPINNGGLLSKAVFLQACQLKEVKEAHRFFFFWTLKSEWQSSAKTGSDCTKASRQSEHVASSYPLHSQDELEEREKATEKWASH